MRQKVVKRDTTFDMMKGIGILLVMIGHAWEIPLEKRFIVYSFHMPLFFIIAGYFSKSYADGQNDFIIVKHYFKRLVPPFVFTTMLTFMFFCFNGFAQNDFTPAIRKLMSLFWADVNVLQTGFGPVNIGVVWFLLALFWAKTFLLFLSRWGKWVLPISFVLSAGALLLHKVFPYSVWCLSLGLVCLPFVAFGWWLRQNKLPLWIKVCLILAWLVAIKISHLDIYSYNWGRYPLDVIGACGGTCFLYLICKLLNKDSLKRYIGWLQKSLVYLGFISLAIMCFHCFEMETDLGNYLRALVGINMPVWALYVWRYALTIALAVAAVHVPKIKKIFV